MIVENHKAVLTVFITALFLYFCSESVLRQATISKLGSKKINIDAIIIKLPEGIRSAVRRKIEQDRLYDALKSASTDKERITAMSNLAFLTVNDSKKEELYYEIMNKYPSYPESSSAFAYFLLNQNSKNSIGIPEYHAYINRCPSPEHYFLWQNGLNQLEARKVPEEKQLEFLKPLLKKEPEFQNYHKLYIHISDLAFKTEQFDIAENARRLEQKCYDLSPIRKEEIGKIKR